MKLPYNLMHTIHILNAVKNHCGIDVWDKCNVYLTLKNIWVNGGTSGNRPGWHSDGFLTDDINYIWYDKNPTLFYFDGAKHSFSTDHCKSLVEMNVLCENSDKHVTYPVKSLLRMDQFVLHKPNENFPGGVRCFMKISLSEHIYALEGNSKNEHLNLDMEYLARKPNRNCPVSHRKGNKCL